jgi:demethylmenaquinone methyltransferase/2-methoxy-6-polyprenyl-1,4-benzoquinol methylase
MQVAPLQGNPRQRRKEDSSVSVGTESSESSVLPAAEDKAGVVRGMFAAIAPRYDLLNHLLSLNRDRAWRRSAVDALLLDRLPDGVFVDACAGTLDMACELARRPGFLGTVIACDFVVEMLTRGAAKIGKLPVERVCADALCLPLQDESVDGITIGFGVRNLVSLESGLRELARVLRPGGRLVVLEFATPIRQPLRALYLFYFRRVLPWLGGLVSRHQVAYRYLPESVLAFPEPSELARLLRSAGFDSVRWHTYTGGIVAVHSAERIQGTATAS